MLVNEDCSVKICDFGLARSIAGVESASLMLSANSKYRNDEDHEMKGEGIEDVHLLDTEEAKIHHLDNTNNEL